MKPSKFAVVTPPLSVTSPPVRRAIARKRFDASSRPAAELALELLDHGRVERVVPQSPQLLGHASALEGIERERVGRDVVQQLRRVRLAGPEQLVCAFAADRPTDLGAVVPRLRPGAGEVQPVEPENL